MNICFIAVINSNNTITAIKIDFTYLYWKLMYNDIARYQSVLEFNINW